MKMTTRAHATVRSVGTIFRTNAVAQLIEAPPILPTQLERRYRGILDTGPGRLFAAVLEEQIHTLRRYRGVKGERAQRLYGETRDWIRGVDADPTWPLTFANICAVLGIDLDAARRALLTETTAPDIPRLRVVASRGHGAQRIVAGGVR